MWSEQFISSELKNVLAGCCAENGDQLYTKMRPHGKIKYPTGQGYIAIAELPKVHTFCNTDFSIKYGESYCGYVGIDQLFVCKQLGCARNVAAENRERIAF